MAQEKKPIKKDRLEPLLATLRDNKKSSNEYKNAILKIVDLYDEGYFVNHDQMEDLIGSFYMEVLYKIHIR